MARFKTFNSTGVAPDGRLYAGDLNAIQDMKADLSNFSQAVDVAQVRFGESGLQMLRHGTLEARVTGAFRTDGIIRGLGGLVAPQFTTAQRDAIPLGYRPNGLIIHNTTLGRLEMNIGSDASPSWQGVGAGVTQPEMPAGVGLVPTGSLFAYTGTVEPVGYLFCRGEKKVRTDFQPLFNVVGTSHNTGGETGAEFRLPNYQGKAIFGRDAAQAAEFGTIGQSGGFKVIPITAIPAHRHVVDSHDHTPLTGADLSHTHAIGTDTHTGHVHGPESGVTGFSHGSPQDAAIGTARKSVIGYVGGTGVGGAHSHGGGTDSKLGTHGHTPTAQQPNTNYQGGTGAAGQSGPTAVHLPPYGVAEVIIKT